MTPAQAKASYARQFAAHGEDVTIKRGGAAPYAGRARITGFDAGDLVGELELGASKVILLAEGLAISPKTTDDMVIRNRKVAIVSIDDSTRRVAGELIAYEIVVTGLGA